MNLTSCVNRGICIYLLVALAGCQAGQLRSPTDTKQLPPASASADPEYEALGGNKAQALSTGQGNAPRLYTNNVANQPTPIAAALRALQECENARAARETPSSPCEIRRKGNVLIHSTAELTRGLEEDRPALLWRLSALDDAGRTTGTVYIAGSIHVLKPTLDAPPSYSQALLESESLVLEIDEKQLPPEQLQALMSRYGSLPEGQSLTDFLSAADYARVTSYTSSLGVPEQMLRQMKPAMVLLQVGVLEYISMGYLAQHGVESVFRAKKGDRKLLALETVEQQLASVTALPLPLQIELLLETMDEIDNTSLEISKLVRAWLAGDEQQLDALFNDTVDTSPAARQWMDDLLTKRNVGMAAGVARLLKSNRTHFVLVGAGHLVGDNSVIALLKQRGVSATRLRQNTLEAALR